MVNSFKQNLGKFQFIILETNTDMFLYGNKIEKFQMVVPLPITIDDKLSFKTHFENICQICKL